MSIVVVSLIILGGMGLLSGVVLAIASRFFAVEVDPRIEKLEKILPGVNCGGCGFPSCFSYAQNIIEKGVEPNCCVLGADIDKISQALGKAVAASEKKTAAIKCYGGGAAVKEFDYNGAIFPMMTMDGTEDCPGWGYGSGGRNGATPRRRKGDHG